MRTDKKKHSGAGEERGLARWENEGGPSSGWTLSVRKRREPIKLAEDERYILYCLGAAVVMEWNKLPTEIQRILFGQAASVSESDHSVQLREQLARFLHNHKDDETP